MKNLSLLNDCDPHTDAPAVVIHQDPLQVTSRLSRLGPSLNEELLLDANMHGYAARLETTPLHATTAAGSLHWHAYVFAFRLAMKREGWLMNDHLNSPSVISPDRTVTILIMTGDIDTGKAGGFPRNQADKGRVLSEAIGFNRTYELFKNDQASGTQLWILLYHAERDAKGNVLEIRTELSLPSKFENGKIVGWTERIILRALPVGREPYVEIPMATPPIDFDIERRTTG